MDITSNHLEVVGIETMFKPSIMEDGDELTKRPETFGHPVSKSTRMILSTESSFLTNAYSGPDGGSYYPV